MSRTAPPQNIEAEMSLIGGIFLDNDRFDDISESIQSHHFFATRHRLIWDAINDLMRNSEPVDLVSVMSQLTDNGTLKDVGGATYLAEISEYVPSSVNLEYYAKQVRDAHYRRELLNISDNIVSGVEEAIPIQDISDYIEKQVFELGDDRDTGYSTAREVLKVAVKNIEFAYENRGTILGVETGFSKLDILLSGLRGGKLVILAARPSMGKSALATNFADKSAVTDNIPTAIFTLEMDKNEIIERMICTRGRVDSGRVRSGHIRESDWPKITMAIADIDKAPIYIDDTPALRLSEFRSRARKMKRKHDIKLIIIDYLQLMTCPGESSRQQEIGAISRGLKAIAKELNVPIVALSQLNRSLESRPNKRPIMSDLRESGDIEQDADIIMFLYREAVYCEDCKNISKTCSAGHERDAELNIAKHRGGSTATLPLQFYGEHTLFMDPKPKQSESGY